MRQKYWIKCYKCEYDNDNGLEEVKLLQASNFFGFIKILYHAWKTYEYFKIDIMCIGLKK